MWVPVLSWENALGVKLCVIFLLLIHPKGIKKTLISWSQTLGFKTVHL